MGTVITFTGLLCGDSCLRNICVNELLNRIEKEIRNVYILIKCLDFFIYLGGEGQTERERVSSAYSVLSWKSDRGFDLITHEIVT